MKQREKANYKENVEERGQDVTKNNEKKDARQGALLKTWAGPGLSRPGRTRPGRPNPALGPLWRGE